LFGGTGATTAAILVDGYVPTPPNNITDATESWNGTAWSEVAELNTAVEHQVLLELQLLELLQEVCCYPNGNVESWNGTAWTEVADLNTARDDYGRFWNINFRRIAGGTNGPSFLANTELWNGSSWTEVNDLATGRSESGAQLPHPLFLD
jgi:hypothetical protein